MDPIVSVVIAAHQAARFVGGAVQSVLAQSFAGLEVIVVDDASTDGTADALAAIDDPRLTVVRLAQNLGPGAAANAGLDRARGAFVARLDADDLAEPGRLAAQVAFLDAHPAVGLLGSACLRIDEGGAPLGVHPVPGPDLAIRLRSLLVPAFVHSSVVWRRALGLRYDPTHRVGCDYALYCQALQRTQAHNLEAPLVRYRVWAGGLTATQGAAQRAAHDAISWAFTRAAWPRLARSQAVHLQLRRFITRADPTAPLPPAARAWLAELQNACLGFNAPAESVEGFARALTSPAGAFGQPLGHAS